FVEVNEALCKLFKYEREKFQHMSLLDVTHPDFLQQSQHATQLLLEGKEGNIQMEKRYIRSDGSSFWALVNLAPMESEPYNIVQIVDITDQKNSELQVKNLNRELENKVLERTQ